MGLDTRVKRENTLTTLTTILIAVAFFLIGAAVGHFLSKKAEPGDKSVRDIEKKLERQSRS